MKNALRLIFHFSFIALVLLSCKKREMAPTDLNSIETAKKWFEERGRKSYSPKWSEAKVIKDGNSEFVVLKSNRNISPVGDNKVESYLVINISDPSVTGRIIEYANSSPIADSPAYNFLFGNTEVFPELHSNIFVFDLNHKFIQGYSFRGTEKPHRAIAYKKNDSLNGKSGDIQTMSVSCDRWYWVEFDIDNNIISAEYLYTTCDQDQEDHGGGGSGGAGAEEKPVIEIEKDSLTKKYPCATALIGKLESIAGYNQMVLPFLQPDMKPTLAWNATSQSWTDGSYSGGNTGIAGSSYIGASSNINLNSDMLDNASELLIAAVAIHETYHAYINYFYAFKVDIDFYDKSKINYMSGLYLYHFYGKERNYDNNYRDHYSMLKNQFENLAQILYEFGGSQKYSMVECRKMLLFGMDNPGELSSSVDKYNLDLVYKQLLNEYKFSEQEVKAFHSQQIKPKNYEKLPKSGCE